MAKSSQFGVNHVPKRWTVACRIVDRKVGDICEHEPVVDKSDRTTETSGKWLKLSLYENLL